MQQMNKNSEAARQYLGKALAVFVKHHSKVKQHDKSWYERMGTTVGGSELAAIMGKNPYMNFYDVVESKVSVLNGVNTWTGGSEACWWGTLFEDVIGAYVAADLGSDIIGDDICISVIPGHRNSPDGYIIARIWVDAEGRTRLWTTDMSEDIPCWHRILVLEFKCPITRKPTGDVPKQYQPQVQSGLAVSPIANLGMYVDAVFRKCDMMSLELSPEYDRVYHYKDDETKGLPQAWGIIYVYAPRLDASRRIRYGWRGDEWGPGDPDDGPDADASSAAWDISCRLTAAPGEPADLGAAPPKLFNRALRLINQKRFPVWRAPAVFADGRGRPPPTDPWWENRARELCPPSHALMGVIPWKLFEVNYSFVERQKNFIEIVKPLIDSVHRTVQEARNSGDAMSYVEELRMAARSTKRAARPDPSALTTAEVQSFFDEL